LLEHAAAITVAINRNNDATVEQYSSESHNYGVCLEEGCAWWVEGACAVAKTPSKLSGVIKALDYLHVAVRSMSEVIRARL
jgi:hypothetical protein